MSQRNQRWLAASALAAALLLAVPAPSPAAGFGRPAGVASGLLARAWAWWENVRILPRPVAVWEKQGSAIDPDGAPRTTGNPEPSSATAPAPEPANGTDDAQ